MIYNKIVASRQNVYEAWADIDVQLKRRHDLIPNLVDVVKGYAKHEKELLETVTKERSEAMKLDKSQIQELSAIEAQIEDNLDAIFALSENYPNLKANENFLKLQSDLVEAEDQIASARRIYNSNTADYNTYIAMFPFNLVAKLSKFSQEPFFQAQKEDTKPVKVA